MVKSYVRDAHLAKSEDWARKALEGLALAELTAAVVPAVRARTAAGAAAPVAVAEALAQTSSVEPPRGSSPEEVAQQMLAPILSAIQDADFAPPEIEKAAAAEAVEEEHARREQEGLLILNGDRGVVHRAVLATLELPPGQMTTACGWTYGSAVSAQVIAPSDAPPGHKALCARCLPRWRFLRKSVGQDGTGAS